MVLDLRSQPGKKWLIMIKVITESILVKTAASHIKHKENSWEWEWWCSYIYIYIYLYIYIYIYRYKCTYILCIHTHESTYFLHYLNENNRFILFITCVDGENMNYDLASPASRLLWLHPIKLPVIAAHPSINNFQAKRNLSYNLA